MPVVATAATAAAAAATTSHSSSSSPIRGTASTRNPLEEDLRQRCGEPPAKLRVALALQMDLIAGPEHMLRGLEQRLAVHVRVGLHLARDAPIDGLECRLAAWLVRDHGVVEERQRDRRSATGANGSVQRLQMLDEAIDRTGWRRR